MDARRFVAEAANARGQIGAALNDVVQFLHEQVHHGRCPERFEAVLDLDKGRMPPAMPNGDKNDMHILQGRPKDAGAERCASLRERHEHLLRRHPVLRDVEGDIRHRRSPRACRGDVIAVRQLRRHRRIDVNIVRQMSDISDHVATCFREPAVFRELLHGDRAHRKRRQAQFA